MNVFNASLPVNTGTQSISGIKHDVSISRDSNGVVYINAANDDDTYFATGFVHAQDRMWQLELQRRVSQGRLSEIFGRTVLNKDVWIRTLGLYGAAEESLPYLSQDAIKSLEAYAAGINAWLKTTKQLPVEFATYGIEPEPWTVIDSLAWVKVFALNLAGNYQNEMQKYIAAQHLTTAQVQSFFPDFNSYAALLSANDDKQEQLDVFVNLFDLQSQIESELKIGGRYVGSNAWVVSGQLTESGAPILANDPHLGLQLPSLWYAISQKSNNLAVDGMSLVGMPLVIFGKNEQIVWGGTNMMADVQDLYLEQVNPEAPNTYMVDGQWQSFNTRIESIKVKNDFPSSLRAELNPVEIEVRESVHGPIISDVVTGVKQPIAMRWTALEKGDSSYEAFYQLNRAKDWNDFKAALNLHVAPAMNFLYADKQNNIGMLAAGKIPVRQKGNGSMPVLGSDPSYDWNGYIRSQQLPQHYNPEQGYLINANNNITDHNYPYFISQDFAPEYRKDRIEQLIVEAMANDGKITSSKMQQMQGDEKDLSAVKLLNRLQQFNSDDERHQQAISLLNDWDAVASKQSVGATIFYGWSRHIRIKLFNDELQNYWNHPGRKPYLSALSSRLTSSELEQLFADNSPWCDDVSTEIIESCEDTLDLALESFLTEMSSFSGSDMDDWQWGAVQQTYYSHTPFSQITMLQDIFERRIGSGGAVNTVNVSTSFFDKNDGYLSVFGAGFRQIMEVGEDSQRHLFMNSTGQSGQVASPHYDDMVVKFSEVKLDLLSPNNSPMETFTLQSLSNRGEQ